MKQELRKWAKEQRKNINLNSEILVKKLTETQIYQQAKNIMIFYPLKDEINLLSLLKDKSKKFFLPKIDGTNLLCCPFSETTPLKQSSFKTMEPLTPPCEKNSTDIIIVPALCCDINNYRLGYGGGFYDRFLKDYKGHTIVCLPKELIVDTVYPENHDIKIDMVITD